MADDWAHGAHLSGRPAMQLGRVAKFPPCNAFGHRMPRAPPSAGHATWSGGQLSSLHCLCASNASSTASAGHVDKTIFVNGPTHGRLAKVMWPAGHTMA
jgi:hypothetical protein